MGFVCAFMWLVPSFGWSRFVAAEQTLYVRWRELRAL